MFKNMTLQARMVSAFVFMGLIVLIVALVGWIGTSRLSRYIDEIGEKAFPSTVSLWKINEAQTQIESSERALLNPRTSAEERRNQITRIEKAWKQIDEGFSEYEEIPRRSEEDKLYQAFLPLWEEWKEDHQEFLQLNQEFERFTILDPLRTELELRRQGQSNSPRIATAMEASDKLSQMNEQAFTENVPAFRESTEAMLELLSYNVSLAEAARNSGARGVLRSIFWIVVGTVIGPLTAVLFGIYFSNAIARPLGRKISRVVGVAEQISEGDLTTQVQLTEDKDEIGKLLTAFGVMTQNLNSLIRQVQQSGIQVTTSATQISASGKQLEATVTEQVASINQVVATTREIAATSGHLVQTMTEVTSTSQATAL
ncbi:MAG: methyl-accepting chemotaxis protein, partial [Coleofasciculus sp. S288]|nr:methyl-accepting chemotaxis protein [Coleofasciculus sp. S288]